MLPEEFHTLLHKKSDTSVANQIEDIRRRCESTERLLKEYQSDLILALEETSKVFAQKVREHVVEPGGKIDLAKWVLVNREAFEAQEIVDLAGLVIYGALGGRIDYSGAGEAPQEHALETPSPGEAAEGLGAQERAGEDPRESSRDPA